MKRIIAIDHEGDNVLLDYETLREAHVDVASGEWLRIRGDRPGQVRAYLNPDAVYAIAEDESLG